MKSIERQQKAYFYDEKKGLFVSGENRQISYASQVWLILGGGRFRRRSSDFYIMLQQIGRLLRW